MPHYDDINQLPPQYREQAYEQTRRPGKTAVPIVVNGEAVDAQPKPQRPLYQKIVLMDERPQSWNTLKRLHWNKWQREVERCKNLIIAAIGPCNTIQQRVKILVTVYFNKWPYDSSNIPLKLFEDGLVAAGLLTDDSMKYVIVTATRSEIDRNRPRTEIEIYGENDELVL